MSLAGREFYVDDAAQTNERGSGGGGGPCVSLDDNFHNVLATCP